MNREGLIKWLLEGDVSIQYQTHRDLFKTSEKPLTPLQQKIATEGWGRQLMNLREENGMWGGGLYSPKWVSTHYTLLLLKRIGYPGGDDKINESTGLILDEPEGKDGGIDIEQRSPKQQRHSDVCVNGMILNFGSYFLHKDERLQKIVDYLLNVIMPDGGWNCRHYLGGVHSSLHTTLSVMVGLYEFQKHNKQYRSEEIKRAYKNGLEFILQHRLYKSDKTGNVIRPSFKLLSFPPRWYYDILKALDHFREAGIEYDERMSDALEVVLQKRNKEGKWPLQGKHPGREHFEMEDMRQPSRWNTLRAMRVLEYYGVNY